MSHNILKDKEVGHKIRDHVFNGNMYAQLALMANVIGALSQEVELLRSKTTFTDEEQLILDKLDVIYNNAKLKESQRLEILRAEYPEEFAE